MMKMMMMTTMMIMMMMMVTSEANMIEQVCNVTSYYDLCVSLVKSDPRGTTANATGIALILVDKVKDVVTTGVKQINDLYKTKPELKKALDMCSQIYKGFIKTEIPEAVYALTKGMPIFADDGMAVAGIEAYFCEQQFNGKSPLTNLTSSLQVPALIIRTIGVSTTTVNQIKGLYKSKPELKQTLDECSESYNAILTVDVPEAIEALTKGNPKFAEDGVVDAGAEAFTCENAFKGKSPLITLTSSLQKISDVARAIVRMLL